MNTKINYLDDLKKLENYLRSDENKNICKPFLLECQRFSDIARHYGGKSQALYEELISKVISEEYSTGGELLHRGYYCPSPILDIIVGNSSRGKILKRLTSKSKPTYRYRFDGNNNIIIINYIHLNCDEIIIRKGELETGIAFSKDFGIHTLSECNYCDSQITSYIYCLYDSSKNSVVEYRKENYSYSEEGLEAVDIFKFLNSKSSPILQHDQYHFQHDENGYLSKYTVINYEGEHVKPSAWDNHIFNITIQRKV
ncbi:hypothetical protein [Faecalispora jeddahensis]|uniref:hypothetical protein n=1 Tax=Faecalispora jeddahensis TaxID=1414721 RepID=UPI00145BEAEC|nr:hypothetical protein [Faecalispora jeddahensis]